jgi:acyl-CoA thioesterase I
MSALNQSPRKKLQRLLPLSLIIAALTALYAHRTFAASPVVRIMPLGDSITQSNKDHNSYRRPLWQMLKSAGYNVDFVGSQHTNYQGAPPNPDFDVDNEGHWGWRVDEVLAQLDGWVKVAQPDIVLVHLGTNNIAQFRDMKSTVNDLDALIKVLRRNNPRVKIVMAEIIPLWGKEKLCQELNAQILLLSQRLSTAQSPIRVVDQFTGFQPEPNKDTFDGAHPNESGEKKMATRWFEKLNPLLMGR